MILAEENRDYKEIDFISNIKKESTDFEKYNATEANIKITKDNLKNIKELTKICSKTSFIEVFELEECVGSGSESYVYRTLIKKNKKKIISKIIYRKQGEKMNMNEILISKKLKNKNIIDCYGAITIKENELDCIMMEYARYGNIRDFQNKILKRSSLTETLLCFISYQILGGLKYIHNCNIAHLDIKPQNIIIDEYLNIKIIDFSVSLDYGKIKSNKVKLPFRGTNFYMAPELIKKKTIDKKDLNKVDLYSLGVIIYFLSFGYFPFGLTKEDSKDYDKIYEKITTNDLMIDNDNNYYSPFFIDFLKKLLDKNIKSRININQALNHYWIKGADILINEKEEIYNASIFLSYLITDHFKDFNDYMKNEKSFFFLPK